MKKVLLAAAVLIAGFVSSAQEVYLHGYMDYTNFAVGQQFKKKTGDDEWSHTEAAAEYGSFYNGRTQVTMDTFAQNFWFNFGVRLDSSLGEWYNLYYDSTNDYDATVFFQGFMRAGFWNEQVALWTGKFEEWNDGYILNGYALGASNIRDLASRSEGQHFTAVEFIPRAVSGFKMIAGVPVLPGAKEDIDYDIEGNKWEKLYKKAKMAASYNWATYNVTFVGGFRPGTYYTGVSDRKDDSDGFSKNYFSEAWFQADMPSLIYGVKMNATYDLRWRKDDEYTKKTVTAHILGASAQITLVPDWTFNIEDRIAYADDHYIAKNEKLLYNILGLQAVHPIAGTSYEVGMNLTTVFAKDANGRAFSSDMRVDSTAFDDLAMSVEWMQPAANPKKNTAGTYFTIYGYPYFQKNFECGYVRTGVEMQYNRNETSNVTQGFTYRVPVALCFWF